MNIVVIRPRLSLLAKVPGEFLMLRDISWWNRWTCASNALLEVVQFHRGLGKLLWGYLFLCVWVSYSYRCICLDFWHARRSEICVVWVCMRLVLITPWPLSWLCLRGIIVCIQFEYMRRHAWKYKYDYSLVHVRLVNMRMLACALVCIWVYFCTCTCMCMWVCIPASSSSPPRRGHQASRGSTFALLHPPCSLLESKLWDGKQKKR